MYEVPADMTYPEWEEKFVEGGGKDSLTTLREDGILDEKMANGEISLKVNTGSQNKHISTSHAYDAEANKSIFHGTLEDAQALINKYSGTGTLKYSRTGNWVNKELITIDEDIGIYKSIGGVEEVTNSFIIHYGKKGSHIVPARRRI